MYRYILVINSSYFKSVQEKTHTSHGLIKITIVEGLPFCRATPDNGKKKT